MYGETLIALICLSVWTLALIGYVITTFIIKPLVKHYRYYKFEKDTTAWIEELIREKEENPDKCGFLDTSNIVDMKMMCVNLDANNIDLSKYNIEDVE